SEDVLPVDPSTDVPAGYTEDQRGVPGGFVGENDIMDTWATSSLTPQIAGGWEVDPDLFERVFPMDLRPQGQDIIRTWLFSTVVRSHLEFGVLPWRNAAISGWILDPDRKKMSKSRGNVVTPMDLLQQYGADGVRYWAAGGRPGADTAFDTGQMKVGRRLAMKILNVSKFVLGLAEAGGAGDVTRPLDQAMLAALARTVGVATEALDAYDYTRALESVERFFWDFCDDYVELVKARAYGESGDAEGARSARVALRLALSVLLRLFAPFLPFATEEVWSWWHEEGQSVHRARWPEPAELTDVVGAEADADTFGTASELIGSVRRAKSEAQLSMRTEVDHAQVRGRAADVDVINQVIDDIQAAGRIVKISIEPDDAVDIPTVTLAI